MMTQIVICSTVVLVTAAVAVFVARRLFLVWRRRQLNKYSRQSNRLMLLLREIIDLAYVYDTDPKTIRTKLLETVSMSSLRKRGIIDPETLLYHTLYNRVSKDMKKEDAELWALLQAGFTPRELMVVYGLTNINSVYVKLHRLRRRLDRNIKQLGGKRSMKKT